MSLTEFLIGTVGAVIIGIVIIWGVVMFTHQTFQPEHNVSIIKVLDINNSKLSVADTSNDLSGHIKTELLTVSIDPTLIGKINVGKTYIVNETTLDDGYNWKVDKIVGEVEAH